MWNVDDSSIVAVGEGHQGVVMAVAANPNCDRPQLASGSNDGTVKLWSINTLSESEPMMSEL